MALLLHGRVRKLFVTREYHVDSAVPLALPKRGSDTSKHEQHDRSANGQAGSPSGALAEGDSGPDYNGGNYTQLIKHAFEGVSRAHERMIHSR
ncbi:MAG: hypothetical protein ACTHQQ_11975 [Solirubrobacteraceae bacterium]